MALATGTKLGPYEITGAIGAGGMGEVYEARDTKLGRNVAIKVLPAVFANDPGRLARFQREAKLLAALNHPNIATIHGLEHSNGTHFLIMELVQGETLADRVNAGPVPIEEALKIAVQITEALEAAHEKNIIHRDLKPANVKVTPEGKVKVLDFGLAKAFEGDETNEDISNSPTLSAAATMQGVILGTAGYMSPEQARGKATDKRTDIWAFGCVLYEVLTGKQAFHGETVTDTTAKILTAEPDWKVLPLTTPTQIRLLLKRCLQKEKALRLQAAGDARIEIQEALAAPTQAAPADIGVGWLVGWRLPLLVGLVALIAATVAGLVSWNLKPAPPQPVSRLTITLPPGQQLAGLDGGLALALSPDGTHLAYVARQGGVQQIYLRAMDSLAASALPGTDGAVNPFFSPDGQWVGFFAGGRLKKVSVTGGATLDLAVVGVTTGEGASWGSQGIIAIAPGGGTGLLQTPDAGGPAQPLAQLGKGDLTHRWPEFLPGGRAVLFTAGRSGITFSSAQIAAQFVGTGERRDLVQGASSPRYSLSGHLVYAQGGNLVAVPFDAQRLAITGGAAPVVQGVLQSPTTGAAQYSISGTGSLAYVAGGIQGSQSRLVWVNRNGTEQILAAPPRSYRFPHLSPDGRRVAVSVIEQESQTWLYDLSRETLSRFTFEGSQNYNSVWTPDGKRIAFESNNAGTLNIFWQLADGSGGLERLTTSPYINAPISWSPDGQLLAFGEVNPTSGQNIWILRMNDRKALPFHKTGSNENEARFSPDGRWLAYVSDESGRYEVYLQPYPGPGGKWQISTEGGAEPVWNPNGRELFYRNGDNMMVVEITTQPGLTASTPRMLFEGRYEQPPVPVHNFDVSPDGQRFLMLEPVEQSEAAPTQIVVVQNWFEELKHRVPTGNK